MKQQITERIDANKLDAIAACNRPTDLVKAESILIIEQNKEQLKSLKEYFENDYEVFTSCSGLQGVNLAYQMIPDLIIAAVNLKEKSGFQIASELKHDNRTAHLPIILLSVNGTDEQKIIGNKQMADSFITYPLNFILLKENIINLLWNRKLLKNRFISELPLATRAISLNKSEMQFLNAFNSIIEQNMANEKFHVNDIAKELGISRIQLYRKAKVVLNCTINDVILNRRLKKAKHLLMNEELPISVITYETGFSSPAYFSAVFKSKYNCTPTDFKKNKH